MDLILTFHSIDSSGSVLSYEPDGFGRLIEGMLEEGVRFAGMDEILRPPTHDAHRALVTFDDGFTSVFENALPVLSRLGVPALLYAVTDWVGRDNGWPGQGGSAPRLPLMSWAALRELAQAGVEVGSHTSNHVDLAGASPEACERELTDSRRRLEDEMQREIRHFAYPYGALREETAAAVARHYATGVTTDMRFLTEFDVHPRLPRVDAYYLRDPARCLPVFGARTRGRLRLRAMLRQVRLRVRG